ncbi:MAG TPA: hypothetical protein VNL94_04440 [Candidatus Binatia bacterium]|nr:hypothetical protein [Candidatus Binatia bacterium]
MHPSWPLHAEHDTLLIAAHAAGDLTESEAARASELLASCPDCAGLHRDLVAIAAATRALPRDARAPRDYRLTADQAQRLRRGSRLRALLRPFASTGTAGRTLAASFTSLGVAGLLVAAFVPGMLGGASSPGALPEDRNTITAAGAPTGPAPEGAVDPMVGVPGATGGTKENGFSDDATGAPVLGAQSGNGGQKSVGPDVASDLDGRLGTVQTPMNLLVAGSLGLLVVGLAMFGLQLVARRVR